MYAVAIYAFDAENEAELTLHEGDVVQVTGQDGEWWEGVMADGRAGLFPANRVEEYVDETAAPAAAATSDVRIQASEVSPAYLRPTPVATSGNNALLRNAGPSSSARNVQKGGGVPASGSATRTLASMKSQASLENSMKKEPPNTRFGRWASNMAILTAPMLGLLGLASIIWGVKDSNRGARAIIVGLYAIILGGASLLYEKSYGLKRQESRMPWRFAAYFVLHVFLYLSVPTIFAAAFVLTVAIANFVSWYLGETYEAPKEKRKSGKAKSRLATSSAASGGGGGGDGGAFRLDTKQLSYMDRFLNWVVVQKEANQSGVLIFLSLYIASNLIIFFWALVVWIDKNNSFAPEERLSGWGPFAKAFGNTLDWNCSIILLPVCRTMIRMLYNASTTSQSCFARSLRWLLLYVPLDKNLDFHKLIAKVLALQAVGHTVMHLFNYINAPDPTIDKFGVWPWISGGVIFVAMLLMYGAVFKDVKSGQFEIFWYSHHCFVIFFFFLLVHGAGFWNPNFWRWFLLPGVLYIIERLMRVRRARKPVVLLSVTSMKPSVISLEFAKEGVFAEAYKEGQYVFLCAPRISPIQWHPFTISSAPQEKTVTVHMKKCGPGSWTRELGEYLSTMGPRGATYFELTRQTERGLIQGKIVGPDSRPLLQIDGPHSAPTQHASEHHTVMVVGSGIGVTPVAATLKSVVLHRWKYFLGQCYPDNAYFFWVCSHRDIDSFRWLIRNIKDAEDEVYDMRAKNERDMNQKRIEIHIFVTSVPKNAAPVNVVVDDEVGFWGVPKEDRHLEKIRAPFNEEDLYATMLCPPEHVQLGDVHVWRGRPKWGDRFAAVAAAHPKGEVGVCFCGNPAIAKGLADNCYEYSSVADGRIFKLYKENF